MSGTEPSAVNNITKVPLQSLGGGETAKNKTTQIKRFLVHSILFVCSFLNNDNSLSPKYFPSNRQDVNFFKHIDGAIASHYPSTEVKKNGFPQE